MIKPIVEKCFCATNNIFLRVESYLFSYCALLVFLPDSNLAGSRRHKNKKKSF